MEKRTLSVRVERKLRHGVQNLNISCDSAAGVMVSPSQSPNRSSGSEASFNLQPHEQGVSKTDPSARLRKVKMGSRQHRAVAAATRPAKIYRADESNFRELVYLHTCQIVSDLPSSGVASEPSSPPTPQSSISTASTWSLVSSPPSPLSLHSAGSCSSSWDCISPLSSPITPHSVSSNSASPLSSPRHGLLCSEPYLLNMPAEEGFPAEVHTEHSTHLYDTTFSEEHAAELSAHLNDAAFSGPHFTTCAPHFHPFLHRTDHLTPHPHPFLHHADPNPSPTQGHRE